jgi:hypothetical protein
LYFLEIKIGGITFVPTLVYGGWKEGKEDYKKKDNGRKIIGEKTEDDLV